jgi:hypothetical protein
MIWTHYVLYGNFSQAECFSVIPTQMMTDRRLTENKSVPFMMKVCMSYSEIWGDRFNRFFHTRKTYWICLAWSTNFSGLLNVPCTYLLTYLRSSALPEKLPIVQQFTEFPAILRNPKVRHRIHKSRPLVPILSQFDPVHTTPSFLSKIHFNIVHQPTSIILVLGTLGAS